VVDLVCPLQDGSILADKVFPLHLDVKIEHSHRCHWPADLKPEMLLLLIPSPSANNKTKGERS
jgi:hypothetical protein